MSTTRKKQPKNVALSPDVLDALYGQLLAWHDRISEVTRNLCYDSIHWRSRRDDHDANQAAFENLCHQYPTIREPFDHDPLHRRGPNYSFIVRAYFRSFVEGVAVALSPSCSDGDHPPPFTPVFTHLLKIADQHGYGIAWVKEWALALIQRLRPFASDWLRMACDGANLKPIEQWRAPILFRVKPGEHDPAGPDIDRQLLPMSVKRSAGLLKAAEDEFVSTLAKYIERDTWNAVLNSAAEQPQASAFISKEPAQGNKPSSITRESIIKNAKDGNPITFGHAAFYFNVTTKTLRNWLEDGKKPDERKHVLIRARKRSCVTAASFLAEVALQEKQ